jgi:hypothetical protein
MGLSSAERQKRYREKKQAEWAALPKVECACGCGTLIAPINKMGKPARYAHGHNPGGEETRFQPGHDGSAGVEARKALGIYSGPGHPNWKGGQWRVGGGYVRVTITPEQAALWPTALKHGNGWSIQRSHKVWNEAHPDDLVETGYHVHHLNHQRDDDRPENLEKMLRGDHLRRHNAEEEPHRRRDPAGRYT